MKWTKKITNEKVLNKTIQKSNVISDISKRQITFVWHIMTKDKLEYLAVTGKIVGKRARGRRRMLFTDQLIKWTNCENTKELFRKATKKRTHCCQSLLTRHSKKNRFHWLLHMNNIIAHRWLEELELFHVARKLPPCRVWEMLLVKGRPPSRSLIRRITQNNYC